MPQVYFLCSNPKEALIDRSGAAVNDQSYSMMTLRIKYKTKDGESERSTTFSLALFP
jgi:hypothetical protein